MTTSFDEMTRLCAGSIDEVLRRQTDIFWNVEKVVIARMLGGLKPTAALEIGAGNAYYLSKLAAEHPACQFLGVDTNKAMLEKAALWLKERNIRNISLGHMSFTELPQRDQFDLVFSRVTVQYFPAQAPEYFAKAMQVLKPGGVLMVYEPADYFMQYPDGYPVLEKMMTTLSGFIGREGRHVSKKFTGYLESNGFTDIEYYPCFRHQHNCGREYFPMLYSWGILTNSLKPDAFTAGDLAALKTELERASTEKGFMCATPLVCVKGRKPL